MNYYKRHLGDYAKDTKTLSVFEHGVYTVLLDEYYTQESPISDDDATALIRPTSAKESASLAKVLSKYFKRDGDVWRHSYADRVIAETQEKADKNRKNGPKGGRPKNHDGSKDKPSDNHDGFKKEPKDNLSHKPLATSQYKEEIPPTAGIEPPDPIFGTGLDFLKRKGLPEKSARSFLGLLRKELHDDLTVAELLVEAERQDVSAPQAWLTAAAKTRKARAGPAATGATSKNGMAIETLERMKGELKQLDSGSTPTLALPGLGPSASR